MYSLDRRLYSEAGTVVRRCSGVRVAESCNSSSVSTEQRVLYETHNNEWMSRLYGAHDAKRCVIIVVLYTVQCHVVLPSSCYRKKLTYTSNAHT